MKNLKNEKDLEEIYDLIEQLESKEEFTCIWDSCVADGKNVPSGTHGSTIPNSDTSCFLVGM